MDSDDAFLNVILNQEETDKTIMIGLENLVDEIDNKSMGTNSICSLYEYGQISSGDEFNNYNSDKDPEITTTLEDDHFTHSLEEEQVDDPTVVSHKKRKITPKEKLSRKRFRHTTEWIDVKSKRLLNLGKEHKNRKGKVIKAKKMGLPCTSKCRMKCSNKIDEHIRAEIFNAYWALGDHTRQMDFINKHVKILNKKQITTKNEQSRRHFSRKYIFPRNGEEIQVCQTMFLQTLDISDKVVHNVCKKLENSLILPQDNRGRHSNRPNMINEEVKNYIREHINNFPVVESHYTREKTKKLYLESDLSITKMHRLYLDWILDKNVGIQTKNATLRQYTDLFNEYNYSFYKPKKDLCDVCEKFKLLSTEEKEQEAELYEEHISNKIVAREKKNVDKEKAIANNNKDFCVAVFDLEKVLQTPQGDVSNFYYKRKFATYNFTVYNIGKKQGYCFVWSQLDGKRGSNEIATCLLKFLKILKEEGIKEFVFYSDNCGGQNRNRFMYAMWEYAAYTLKVKITHRFLEKGHTQNEGDSMHATIEHARKGKLIYVPDQWVTIIRCAKVKGDPYIVFEMSYEDFLNFKPLVENSLLNWKSGNNGQAVKWNSIKEILVTYESPFTIEFKYKLDSVDSMEISLLKKRQRGRHITSHVVPLQAYKQKLPVEEAKIKDLMSLCKLGLIPKTYHSFYSSLFSNSYN